MGKYFILILIYFFPFLFSQAQRPLTQQTPFPPETFEWQVDKTPPEQAEKEMRDLAQKIAMAPIQLLPVQQNGRLKPLETLARESLLFISGSYRRFGLDPVQTYLALNSYSHASALEILEIRDVNLRQELGFPRQKRLVSLVQLEKTELAQKAEPLFQKQEENSRLLKESEKNILETYQQMTFLRNIIQGQSLAMAADYSFLDHSHGQDLGENSASRKLQQAIKTYFQAISESEAAQLKAAQELLQISKTQKPPEILKHYLDKLEIEVFYNHLNPFFWAALLALVLGFSFLTPLFRNKVSLPWKILLSLSPILFMMTGLALRIYITQFAPITNMYGTMIWVSFGVTAFGLSLFLLYQQNTVLGICLIASGLLLMLTEQIPLILSPDLDPIVAVLRNNFWLSTHVTTITISYAAFAIAMVLGNITLIRLWIYQDYQANNNFIREFSHYAYRMIQLGCFLLSVGIILGGIWADYSWGRFWGWDPKETWALIADLGFLIILHGRFVGWITPFTLLLWSPIAFLLVIMAWYGVNFILAAGLHSYGFSSGGTLMVCVFVIAQIGLLLAGLFKYQKLKPPQRESPPLGT